MSDNFTVEVVVRDADEGETIDETVIAHGLTEEDALELAEKIEAKHG